MSLPAALLAVTDRHGRAAGLADTVRAILDGGGRWIWLRDPDLDPAARRGLAESLLALARAAGASLTIGRDAALAAAIGADGVHLPGGTRPRAIAAARRILAPASLIGVSAHGPSELAEIAAAGADYVTLSPIFETASKPGYGPALGLAGLRAAAAAHGLPVLALGGVGAGNASACRAAGAAGIAVMGGLMRARDPAAATRAFLGAWERGDPTGAENPPRLPPAA
ncbi:thiamine phosphate synthase [Methylobacterium nigriterrae]|uniref:thiamine phosphate synthase n=1 Tax=Methylobacterium nigriterrae TaxID=3127512 RepID=UPI0030138637